MRIVLLAPFARSPKATVSVRMLPLARTLAAQGHEVHVLIPPYDNPPDSGACQQEGAVRIENVPMQGSGWPGLVHMAQHMAIRARALGPDVVHVFKPVGVAALAMLLLARQRPAMRFVVDNDDWEGRGGWLSVYRYPLAYKLFMLFQERWSLRRAHWVTCASEVLLQRSRALRGHAQRLLLLPNGADRQLRQTVEQLLPHRSTLRAQMGWDDTPVIIYGGNLPLQHDLDVAMRALAGLRDLRWRWVLFDMGDGARSFREALARTSIAARVEWCAPVPYERFLAMLVAADVGIFPYRDTPINRAKCSGKVVDYMACAKPMVVSDVGMNRLYLDGGRCGKLTPPGDVAAFRCALHELLADPEAGQGLGRAAQERLWAIFSWEAQAPALIAAYQDCATLARS